MAIFKHIMPLKSQNLLRVWRRFVLRRATKARGRRENEIIFSLLLHVTRFCYIPGEPKPHLTFMHNSTLKVAKIALNEQGYNLDLCLKHGLLV